MPQAYEFDNGQLEDFFGRHHLEFSSISNDEDFCYEMDVPGERSIRVMWSEDKRGIRSCMWSLSEDKAITEIKRTNQADSWERRLIGKIYDLMIEA